LVAAALAILNQFAIAIVSLDAAIATGTGLLVHAAKRTRRATHLLPVTKVARRIRGFTAITAKV
jgi:hypothetical protein